MLTKRKNKKIDISKLRHGANDDIVIFWELKFDKDVLTPGTRFRIKNDRNTYSFDCFAHNIKLDVTWVDARCIETGEFRSFRVDRIKSVVKTKISRVKKK